MARRAVLLEQLVAPRVVANAAAYTGVDAAETEADRAFAVNRDGPGFLSKYYWEGGLRMLLIGGAAGAATWLIGGLLGVSLA